MWVERFPLPPGHRPPAVDVPRTISTEILGVEEWTPPSAPGDAPIAKVLAVRWASAEAAGRDRSAFLAWYRLDPALAPDAAGAAPVCRPATSWWRRLAARCPVWWRLVTGVVVGGTAVYALLAAVEKHYATLFERPVLRLERVARRPNVVVGEAATVALRLLNGSSNVDSRVALSGVSVTGAEGLDATLADSTGDSAILAPGAGHDVVVNVRGSVVGLRTLACTCRARSGWLRGGYTFRFVREVDVWAELDIAAFQLATPGRTGTAPTIDGNANVRFGRAIVPGASVRVSLDGVPAGVRLLEVRAPFIERGELGTPSLPDAAGNVRQSYVARARAVAAFTSATASVTLAGPPRSPEAWAPILARLSLSIRPGT